MVYKAPYLGYGDVVELQSQLVHVNLAFATEIADVQEFITKEFNRMIDKIADIVDYPIKPSEYIEITLIPPVVLILQLIEMTSGSAQNTINIFQNLQLPIDPISFLKKYVPFIDWDKNSVPVKTKLIGKNLKNNNIVMLYYVKSFECFSCEIFSFIFFFSK